MAEAVLPAANAADIAEHFGCELPGGISVRYARTMDDVLEVVLPDVFDVSPHRRGRDRSATTKTASTTAASTGHRTGPGGSCGTRRPGT